MKYVFFFLALSFLKPTLLKAQDRNNSLEEREGDHPALVLDDAHLTDIRNIELEDTIKKEKQCVHKELQQFSPDISY